MAKKITITLDDVAEKYFNEVMFSLDLPHKTASQSDVISHILNEAAAFECITQDQLSNWLDNNHKEAYKKWIKDNNIKQYDWETGKEIISMPCDTCKHFCVDFEAEFGHVHFCEKNHWATEPDKTVINCPDYESNGSLLD